MSDMPGPRCRICPEPPGPVSPAFCATHYRAYRARQKSGVATTELDARWLDTLAIWRERPSILATEPDAQRFMFERSKDHWLLFWRGYASRLPDWIAINARTGQTRRFVEASGLDAADDLNGVWAAPHQENLDARWGRPEPRETEVEQRARYLDERKHVNLGAVVRDALMPTYGLAGRPFGLTLATFSWSRSSHGVLDLSLTFVSPTRLMPSRACIVRSIDPRYFRTIRNQSGGPAWLSLRLAADQILNAYYYHCDAWKTIDTPPDDFADQEVTIDGTVLHGPLAFWTSPVEAVAFRFSDGAMDLQGCAFGLARRDLPELFAHLVAVGNRPDLLANYIRELDRNGPEGGTD